MGKRKIFKNVFHTLLITALAYWIYFFFKIIYESQINNYRLSENLLFYTDHFFRRALWGTFVVKVLHIHDYQTFFFLVYASIFLLILLYFLFINKNIFLRMTYLASPIGFLLIGDRRAFARKETLFIPFIFLALLVLKSPLSQKSKMLCMLLFSIVMSCIHDTFIFLVFPLFLYLMMKEGFENKLVYIYFFFVLSLTVFIGSLPVPAGDVAALNSFFVARHIGWDFTRTGLTNNLSLTLQTAIQHMTNLNFILFIIIALLHAVLLNYFFREKFREHKVFLILQYIFVSALFVMAMDYGRWISFAFFNTCILLSVYSGSIPLQLNQKDLYKLSAIAVLMLCIRVPIWSQFYLNDPTLYYQHISPVILHALNLPGNDF
jgi:hypothetical protein